MRQFTILLHSLLLISCNPIPKEAREQKQSRDRDLPVQNHVVAYENDTLQLNGLTLIQTSKEGRFVSLATLAADSVVKERDYYFQVAYPDIDEDGYKDVRVTVVSKTPNQSENYFYDEQAQVFKPIANSYLDIKKIKGSQLFYSYNSTGCSDQSWESRLSKVENWEEITIGYIRAKGCGEKGDGLYMYKVTGNKETLLEQLPIEAIKQGTIDKWTFIEQYWTMNSNKFEP